MALLAGWRACGVPGRDAPRGLRASLEACLLPRKMDVCLCVRAGTLSSAMPRWWSLPPTTRRVGGLGGQRQQPARAAQPIPGAPACARSTCLPPGPFFMGAGRRPGWAGQRGRLRLPQLPAPQSLCAPPRASAVGLLACGSRTARELWAAAAELPSWCCRSMRVAVAFWLSQSSRPLVLRHATRSSGLPCHALGDGGIYSNRYNSDITSLALVLEST